MPAASATMRAAVVSRPGSAALERIARPEPSPGEVRIRMEGCGVCGSNLALWEGRPWFSYPVSPGAPGHEGWGVVEALGDGVAGPGVGDRVAALSSHAFAEYDLAGSDGVALLPESFAGRDFPGEAIGCVMNAFRRADVRPGQTVAVIGIGFLGALLTRLAANAGARVIAISRRSFALEVGRSQGADVAIQLQEHGDVVRRVQELTAGEGADRVFEVVGLQGPLDLAGELTRVRGRLIIAGYHQDGPRQVDMQLWNWRGLDVVNAHERDPAVYLQGIRDAIEAVASGRIDPTPLYTHRFPLDRLDDALEAMRTRPDGFLKALVVP